MLVWPALLALLDLSGCASRRDPLPGFPPLMLWAWERPEDLRFLNPRDVGVAYLAETVKIREGTVTVLPRLQPLRIAPGTKLMAVVRVESSGRLPDGAEGIAGELLRAAKLPDVTALELDMDAKPSERAFYRELIRRVRAGLPANFPLQITALVSWCIGDRWIEGLPVDDAVPMYFRMGAEPFLRNERLRAPVCQSSVGLSTDELVRVSLQRRVFLFHPRPWTREAFRAAVSEINRWH